MVRKNERWHHVNMIGVVYASACRISGCHRFLTTCPSRSAYDWGLYKSLAVNRYSRLTLAPHMTSRDLLKLLLHGWFFNHHPKKLILWHISDINPAPVIF